MLRRLICDRRLSPARETANFPAFLVPQKFGKFGKFDP
jgi:hypothetical protein